ncbi:unnamed protein product [Lota lota]
MQFVARKNKWPLVKMCLSVEKGVMAEATLKKLTPGMLVLFVKVLPLEQRAGQTDTLTYLSCEVDSI